jgi:hypothetical protein
MDSHLHATHYHGTLLVLISEWGLEHATADQIRSVSGVSLPGFNAHSPIIETIRYLQKGLTKIFLLPADLGLVVGLESGQIYLENAGAVGAQNVEVEPTNEGLSYGRSPASLKTDTAPVGR